MDIIASVTPNKTVFSPLFFSADLDSGLPYLAELGYQGIELSLRTKDDVDRAKLNRRLESLGLRLYSIGTGQSFLEDGLSLFSTDESVRDAAVGRIRDHIDFASDWNACVIVGGIRGKMARAGDRDQYETGCRSIEKCVEYATKKNATILLEAINRYETNTFNSLQEVRGFMEGRASDNFLMLPDTFHMNIEEADIVRSVVDSKDYVGAIHFADSNRLAPGMGHIDFGSIVNAIGSFKHVRFIGVEVLPLPDSRTAAKKAMETIRAALKGMQK
ncbi:MAG: sugar phosphate isomerase/epimerase family protein [Rectinema sp.]